MRQDGRAEERKSGRAEERKSGRAEERKSGRAEEWKSARVEEWKSGRVQEWKSARVEERKSARVEECKSGRAEEWKSGRAALQRRVKLGVKKGFSPGVRCTISPDPVSSRRRQSTLHLPGSGPLLPHPQHRLLHKIIRSPSQPDRKQHEIPGPRMLSINKQLLPQIKAVADSPQPFHRPHIQNPIRPLDYMEQQSSNRKVHHRPQHEQQPHRHVKSQHTQIDWNQDNRQDHRQRPRLSNLRQPRRENPEQTPNRQHIRHRRKRLIRPPVQSQKMTRHPIHRRERNHSHQDRHPMPIPPLQHSRPQKVKLLLHTQRPQMPQKPRMRKIKVRQIQSRSHHVIPAQLMPEDHKHRHHKHNRRRQNPISPPHIKFPQSNRRSPAIFLQQQRRNQIPRNNKKDSHPQIRKRPRHIPHRRRLIPQLRPMSYDHQQNRNRPQPIQRRNPLHPRSLPATSPIFQ